MHSFYLGLRRFFTVLLGLVFFASGVFKLMDPVGTGFIVEEYCKFLHLAFMVPASKVVGVALSLTESLVGISLLSGVMSRITGVVASVMTLLFTVITVLLLVFNPPMDCGCFGQVLHLTHLQSLIKNLVLLVFCVVAFIPLWDGFRPWDSKYVAFGIVSVAVVCFAIYSLVRLPLIDFTPFAPGMEIYSGENEGEMLPIRDLSGEYCDDLATEGAVLIISLPDGRKISASRYEEITRLADSALSLGIRPLVLASSFEGVPAELLEYLYFADRRALLTLNRSNGGASLVVDGVITAKFAVRSLPEPETLSSLCDTPAAELASEQIARGRIVLQSFLLLSSALLILL